MFESQKIRTCDLESLDGYFFKTQEYVVGEANEGDIGGFLRVKSSRYLDEQESKGFG